MKAGATEHEVGTRIRITKIGGGDEDDLNDQILVGLSGELTHPFPGLMFPGVEYVAGVWLEPQGRRLTHQVNLTAADEYLVLTEEEEAEPTCETCGKPHNPDHGQYCPTCS